MLLKCFDNLYLENVRMNDGEFMIGFFLDENTRVIKY